MDPLELKEHEDSRYYFKPLSFQFMKSHEWDGALADLKWLLPWVKPFLRKLYLTGILFLISTLIAVGIPKIVATIVDDVLISRKYSFLYTAILLAVLMLFKIFADITYKWNITKIGQSISTNLRQDVFYELGNFPLSFFDKNSSGRVISRCVNDVTNLSSFFSGNFFTVISDFALILGSVLFMFTLSYKSGLIVLITLIPMTIFMLNVSQAQMRWGRAQRNILSRLSSHTGDTMNNLAVLHSQSYSSKWSRRHNRLQEQFSSIVLRNILTWGSFSSTHVLVMGLTYVMVITLGIYQLQQGEISLGKMIGSFTYVGLIFGPFFEISEKLSVMFNALGSVKRLKNILPTKLARHFLMTTDALNVPKGSVRFKELKFAYRSDVPLFQSFDLEIPEGEVTALVGRTGSGKTTLAHLLLGLYPLTSGEILWGDEDINSFSTARRSRWISHVSQDLFIFSDTIRENLRLWREEITDKQIMERLKLVGLETKVEALPGGLNMLVKAETLPLSQGEKQLLLLCRALLQDPRLLVFDEATASLDQLTEDDWLIQVSKLFKNRTTLFIAHRLETLKLASRIVVLENGKIKKMINKKVGEAVSSQEIY